MVPARWPSATARKHLAWLLLGMFAGIACMCSPYGPYEAQYTRREPAMEDVAGTYVLTEQTVTDTPLSQLEAEDGSRFTGSRIVLYEDGTFEAITIPRWVEQGEWDWGIDRFVSGSGRWSITPISSNRPLWGIRLFGIDLGEHDLILLGSEAPRHRLLFRGYIPDPDSSEAMVYQQKAKPPKLTSRFLRRIALQSLAYMSPPLQWAIAGFQAFPGPSMVILALGLLAWALSPRRSTP
jgi:hypothetical protein